MIKNVFIFTLLQIYVSGKKYDLRKGKNVIFNVIYRSLCTDKSMFRQASTGTIFKCTYLPIFTQASRVVDLGPDPHGSSKI